MSQLILFKSEFPDLNISDVNIRNISKEDDLYYKVYQYYWKNDCLKNIWTISSINGLHLDDYFTLAQEQLQKGINFENTKIYLLFKQILSFDLEVISWYSEYYDNLDIVSSIEEVLNIIKKGILCNGMCEVYFRYIPECFVN